MSTFKVELPSGINWEGADFRAPSVWGNENRGKNLWGWPNGAPLNVSDPFEEDNCWKITVTLERPYPGSLESLAFISRYKIDGSFGVFATMLN